MSIGPTIEIRRTASATKHVAWACTLSVVLGSEAERTTSYTGQPALRWRGRLDSGGCHTLDVLAEDHLAEGFIVVFHAQPIRPPGPRRSRANRRR